MKRNLRLLIYLAALCAGLALPLAAYLKWEKVTEQGETRIFRVEGYDPYSPFRGRFLRITLKPDQCPGTLPESKAGTDLYIRIGKDSQGMARIEGCSLTPPEAGAVYWKIRRPKYRRWPGGTFPVQWPCDRYYLNEPLAVSGEKLLREPGKRKITAEVRLLNGCGVLKEIFVDGVPLSEFLRKAKRK